jgi:hypothetical protein
MYALFKAIRSGGLAFQATAHMALAIMRGHDDATHARAYANIGRPHPCRSGELSRWNGVSASHGSDQCWPGGWTPFDPRRGAEADRALAAWYGRSA